MQDGDLTSIKKNILLDDDERLAEMLRTWRESCCSPYTWHTIINVLEARTINLKRAAKVIHSRLSEGGDMYEKYSKK